MNTKMVNRIQLLIIFTFIIASSNIQAQSVMQRLKNHKETTYFAEALENSNLDDRLNQEGPYTLFAPSNEVFNALSNGQKSDDNLLLNHIFIGMATERSLKAMSDITCLSGRTITVRENNKQLTVNSFVIMTSNIRADNGVIHIIDGVLK